MNDLHIKLNEIVSPHHIQAKQRGPIYVLNNSLKRNTVPSVPDSCTALLIEMSAVSLKSTTAEKTSRRCSDTSSTNKNFCYRIEICSEEY